MGVPAEQSDFLRGFYEAAWYLRWQWMKDFIAKGARHPLTVVRNFAAQERLNHLAVDDSGVYRWKKTYPAESGAELLPSGTPAFRESTIRGQFLQIPFHVQDQSQSFLVDFAATNGPFDLVVELGCGYGRNLFEIAYSGLPLGTRLVGGELTKNGVEAANAIAALDSELDITVRQFDFVNPDLSWVTPGKRTLVYTCHAIEQVKLIDEKLIKAICGLGETVVVVHLEPFGFQIQPKLGPVTEQQRTVFEEKEWNLNLCPVLQAAQACGLIQLDYLATEIFLPISPLNATSLAVWHKSRLSEVVGG